MAKITRSRAKPVKIRRVKSTNTAKKTVRKKVVSRRMRRGRSLY